MHSVRLRRHLACLLVSLVWGCGDGARLRSDDAAPDVLDDDDDDEGLGPCEPVTSPQTLSEPDRPAEVQGPTDWCANHPLPVVVLLHGYSATAALQDLLFRLNTRVEEKRFLLVLPDGTVDAVGNRHWNATPACCDFYGAGVDDVGYLSGLLDELNERFSVDPDRVYFTGHSNGGFMSYRMACEIPERIAAIAPLAGSTFLDEGDCTATLPVSVLHMHPTLDTQIPYDGSAFYPGAEETARRWAERNGCDTDNADNGDSLDLVNNLSGSETRVVDYRSGCDAGFDVTLWSIEGAGHVPIVNDDFSNIALDWLLDRRR